jgi:hypothetical protein
VRCGVYYQCVYSNECVAQSVGFLAGCTAVPSGEPSNPIEPPAGNLPSNTADDTANGTPENTSDEDDASAAAGVVLAIGNLASIAAVFSAGFFF